MSATSWCDTRPAGVADRLEQLGAPSPRARGRSCRARASRRAARRSRAAPPRGSRPARGAVGRSRGAGARIVCSVWSFMVFATRNGASPSAAKTGPRCARSTAISRAARSDGASGFSSSSTRGAEREGDRAQHRRAGVRACRSRSRTPATARGRCAAASSPSVMPRAVRRSRMRRPRVSASSTSSSSRLLRPSNW